MTDVLGGNIPLVYTAIAGAISHVKAGKLHPVAVSSARRASSLPDVPTFIENGLADFEASSWVGLLAPAKTPKAIVEKLNTELNAVLNDPEVREKLNGLGITAAPGSAERFGQDLRRDQRTRQVGSRDSGRRHQGRISLQGRSSGAITGLTGRTAAGPGCSPHSVRAGCPATC